MRWSSTSVPSRPRCCSLPITSPPTSSSSTTRRRPAHPPAKHRREGSRSEARALVRLGFILNLTEEIVTIPFDPQALAERVQHLSERERRVIAHLIHRKTVARDSNAAFDAGLTFGQRVADRVAAFGGSWTFILLFLAFMGVWLLYNSAGTSFDPFPFILLNLILSMLAALQAPVIMMSQNRQAVKDRMDAQHDYEINMKAELEILALHSKVDHLREQQWVTLIELQDRQLAILTKLAAKLDC